MKFISLSGLKKYTQNTGYLILEKIVRIIVGITVWAAVARYLGPCEFGIFNYALSFVFLFQVCVDLGLNFIVVREILKNAARRFHVLGTAFSMKFTGAVLAMFLIFIITHFMPISYYTRCIIIMVAFRLIFRSFDVIDFYFQSRVLSKYVVFSQIAGLITISILCLAFIHFQLPLIYFVYAAVLELAVTGIGYIVFYRRDDSDHLLWQSKFDIAKTLIKDAWPLIIAGIAISVYMRIDQIMIKELLDIASVGYYSAAVRISEAFYFIPVILAKSLFPAIVNAKLRNEAIYRDRLQALFTALLWTAVGISIITTVVFRPVVNILYGSEYSPAAGVLAIHIWASIFVFLGVVRTKWIINENLQIFAMAYTVIGAITNVLLNLVLIKAYGIKGAAIATVLSQFVAGVLSGLLSKRTRPIFFMQLAACNPIRIFKEIALRVKHQHR